MLPQQQTVLGIEDANEEFIPLHSDQASDPAWGQAVVGGFDFDTTVQMHDPLAVLVVAERLLRQWEQGRFFLGKHGGDLRLKDPPREIDGFVRNWAKTGEFVRAWE